MKPNPHELYFLDNNSVFDGHADDMLVRQAEAGDFGFMICSLMKELPNRFASRNTNKHVFADLVKNNPAHVLAYHQAPKVIVSFMIAHPKATIVYTTRALRGHGFGKYLMEAGNGHRS